MGCTSYDPLNYEENQREDYLTKTIFESIMARKRAKIQDAFDAERKEQEDREKELMRQQYLLDSINPRGPKSYVDNLINKEIPKMEFGILASEEEIINDLNDRECEEYGEGEKAVEDEEEMTEEEIKEMQEKNKNEMEELKRQLEEMNKKSEEEKNKDKNKNKRKKRGKDGYFEDKKENKENNEDNKNNEDNNNNEEKISELKNKIKKEGEESNEEEEKEKDSDINNKDKKNNKEKTDKKENKSQKKDSDEGDNEEEEEEEDDDEEGEEGEGGVKKKKKKKKKNKNEKLQKEENTNKEKDNNQEEKEEEEFEINNEESEDIKSNKKTKKSLREKNIEERRIQRQIIMKELMKLKAENPFYADKIKKYKYPKKEIQEKVKPEFSPSPTEIIICVIGEQKNGKTSFIKKYTRNVFEEIYKKTENIDTYDETEAEYDSKKIKLIILDTPPLNDRKFTNMIQENINKSHIILYIVDINDEYADFKVKLTIQNYEFSEKQIVAIIGNKSDKVSIFSKKNKDSFKILCSVRKYIFETMSCQDNPKNEIENFMNNKIIKEYFNLYNK